MDDQTRKVLRRVCAQYYTGIRKPFGIDGVIYQIKRDRYAPSEENENDFLAWQDDVTGKIVWQPLGKEFLTPEFIIDTINISIVTRITES